MGKLLYRLARLLSERGRPVSEIHGIDLPPPGGILTIPDELSGEARKALLSEWQARHAGCLQILDATGIVGPVKYMGVLH